MKNNKLSRRAILKLMAAMGGGLAASPVLKLLAQDATATPDAEMMNVATADDVALTDEEIEMIREMGISMAFGVNHRTDDFINLTIQGAQEAAEAYGIELIVTEANFDASVQLSQVESFIQQGVSGIFLIAVDGDTLSSAVLQANEAEIPVVVIGGPPAEGELLTLMNSTSYEGCYDSCKFLLDTFEEAGEIGVIHIPLALSTIVDRENGTRDAITEAGWELVAFQPVLSQDEALAAAENMIQANPNLKAIFATWSLAVNGALAAIQSSGLDIKLSGYDAERAGFQQFEDQAMGNSPEIILSLAGQQALVQGKAGIDAFCKHALGQEVAPDLLVPTILVTGEDYREKWDELYPGITAPWAEAEATATPGS
jgi:ribose transport system substrate-binding protein